MSICQRSSSLKGMVENVGVEPAGRRPHGRAPWPGWRQASGLSNFTWFPRNDRFRRQEAEGCETHRLKDFLLISVLSRKEVFQPHLPVRLPCYDLAPITSFALGRSLRSRTSGTPGFHGLTGGVYKARERIHRAMADARLLANPASWGRVADPSPN